MPLPVPVLDNLNFDELIGEARELIPRYARAWTDHNLSNPGPTLIDLVAWIVDQQIWATGFLSDAHIESFAKLLGEKIIAAQPAAGVIWPDTKAIDADRTVAGANVAADAKLVCAEQPEMGFVLARDVHLSRAQLLELQLTDHATVRRFDVQRPQDNNPVSLHVENGVVAPIYLRFDRPVVESMNAGESFPVAVGIELDGQSQKVAALPYGAGSVVVDYRTAPTGLWQRASVVRDDTFAMTRTGVIEVQVPKRPLGTSKLEHEMRISTRNRVHPLPPVVTRIALNAVSIRQLEIRPMRVIGDPSNGDPDQTFDLELDGLPDGETVAIQVELRTWHAIDDLHAAHAGSRVFQLLHNDNKALFGNGVNGLVPARGVQIRHLPYRQTNGTDGNLAGDLTWHFPSAPLSSTAGRFGSNRAALSGGINRTTIDELQRRARAVATTRNVLLTNNSLEDAATSIESLALANVEVLAQYSPLSPGRTIPGSRTLLLTPQRAPTVAAEAAVPARYVNAVRRALNERRVIGERLHFAGSARIVVRVRAHLQIEDGYDVRQVLDATARRLDARLSDVQTDPAIEPWPAGRDVTVNELKALIAAIDGIVNVKRLQIAREGDAWQKKAIELPRDSIAVAGRHVLKRVSR